MTLIQISSTRNTCKELESQVADLKDRILSVEATSRKALEKAIEEGKLKVCSLYMYLTRSYWTYERNMIRNF